MARGEAHSLPMVDPYAIPQREIARQWERVLAGGEASPIIRAEVRASWSRSRRAGVDPALTRAPIALDPGGVDARRRRAAWLRLLEELARGRPFTSSALGCAFTIFDADGLMLVCQADPRLRARMAELNFAPGALWAEGVVGTNGPGTALVIGAPVLILGAEHFCRTWHPWQCAAAPLRDPSSGKLLGAVNVTGPREQAHPHTLEMVRALALALERSLAAAALERRVAIMQAFLDESGRRPGDLLAAADRGGRVVAASPGAPASLRAGSQLDLGGGDGRGGLDEAALGQLGARAALPLRRATATSKDGELLGWLLVLAPRERTRPRPPRPNGTRYTFADLVGTSAPLDEVRRVAASAASNDLPVLVLGESGVGKEVLAQAIHAASARRAGPFVAVNCAALPPELLESELFGYAPGAFTGARRDGGSGRFEVASGGTLFLDEIGELPHPAQAALLRVLQEGEITRVGSSEPRRVDVRVIAATQRQPGEAVRAGVLRKDLYYRLAVLPCELPPLRARREDIPLLVERFLDEASAELGGPRPRVADEVWPVLAAHDWPGNVRELKNLVRRLVATAAPGAAVGVGVAARGVDGSGDNGGGAGGIGSLGHDVGAGSGSSGGERVIAREHLPFDLVFENVNRRSKTVVAVADDDGDPAAAGGAERERFLAALGAARTLGDAARALGIGRSTLYRRMARYGLEPRRTFGAREPST